MRPCSSPAAENRKTGNSWSTVSFSRMEDGSLSVFAVFVFFAMLLVSGLAVDMMRHENTRLRMQGTTDRAVLAAAMLRENVSEATPNQIVEAYFAAEGLTAQLGGRIEVTEDAETGRTVTVVPAATVPALFMNMIGVDDFSIVTPAQAVEAVGGASRIELVMVLDISGSMGGQNKIGAMRDAASDLVETLLTDDPDNVSITLVPYNDWVLPPPSFLDSFPASQGAGACGDWALDDGRNGNEGYGNNGNGNNGCNGNGHINGNGNNCPAGGGTPGSWYDVDGQYFGEVVRRNCSTQTWRETRPYMNDLAAAQSAINALQSGGTTSIDLGLRYGSLFFDDSIRPAVQTLVDNGQVDPDFAGRPFAWDEPNVLRAIILLTDGQNCCGQRFTRQQQDLNTLSVCSGLKDRNTLLYTIAFQAPTSSATLLEACASSPSHFFNADISEIAAAFAGIGSNIQTQSLRLTQ